MQKFETRPSNPKFDKTATHKAHKKFNKTIYKYEKKKQYISDRGPEHTMRSQQLGLPCLSLSSPSSASMST